MGERGPFAVRNDDGMGGSCAGDTGRGTLGKRCAQDPAHQDRLYQRASIGADPRIGDRRKGIHIGAGMLPIVSKTCAGDSGGLYIEMQITTGMRNADRDPNVRFGDRGALRYGLRVFFHTFQRALRMFTPSFQKDGL